MNEEKVQNNDISICMAETTLVDRIREELMENLEEEWDITQSLTEIKLLDQENKT